MSKKTPSANRDVSKSKKKPSPVSFSYENNTSKSTTSGLTEKDLLEKLKSREDITPDDILKLNGPTESGFFP